MKTVIVIALVLFIIGGLVFLQFKNKKNRNNARAASKGAALHL